MDSMNNERLILFFGGRIVMQDAAFKNVTKDETCMNSFDISISENPLYVVTILLTKAVAPSMPCGANLGLKKLSFIRKKKETTISRE